MLHKLYHLLFVCELSKTIFSLRYKNDHILEIFLKSLIFVHVLSLYLRKKSYVSSDMELMEYNC